MSPPSIEIRVKPLWVPDCCYVYIGHVLSCLVILLFTGDGDFCRLVEALQRRGAFVTIVSSLRTKPAPVVADELRRQADAFLDLDDLKDAVARN